MLIPDFAEPDWVAEVWPIAERLHALEALAATERATASIHQRLQELRDMLTPLVQMAVEDSAAATHLLATTASRNVGADVLDGAPPSDGSQGASATPLMRNLTSALSRRPQ